MPAMKSAADITHLKPLWRALGWHQDKHGTRYYWLEVGGSARRFRAPEMCGLGFLAEVYPYMEHWRRQFPTQGRGIDTRLAVGYFVRACQAAGEYDPAAHAKDATSV